MQTRHFSRHFCQWIYVSQVCWSCRHLQVCPVNCRTIAVQDKVWFVSHLKTLKYFNFQKNWYIILCLICMHSCWNCIFESLLVSYVLGRMCSKVPDTHEQSGKSGTPLIACLTSKWDLCWTLWWWLRFMHVFKKALEVILHS